MVVAADHQHAAQRAGAEDVAVLERVTGPVYPRALAVPEGKDPVHAPRRVQRHALRAQAGGGRQVLIDRGQELHAGRFQQRHGLPHLLVHHAQRAAPVTADKPTGAQAGGGVALALH